MEQRLKNRIAQIKISMGCADCGYNANAGALHFDHHSPKERNVSQCTTWQEAQTEMARAVLRCANCHAVRTWPHLNKEVIATLVSSKERQPYGKPAWGKEAVKKALLNGTKTRKELIGLGFATGSVDRWIGQLIDEGFLTREVDKRHGWTLSEKEAPYDQGA